MPVNWLWKNKVGEVHYFDKENNQHFKLDMYTGNMMCCFIYHFTKEDEETHKKQKMYNFIMWLNDIDHAKRILKDDKEFFKTMLTGNPTFRKFKLKVFDKKDKNDYSCKEMLKLAKLLVEYGYKVELY